MPLNNMTHNDVIQTYYTLYTQTQVQFTTFKKSLYFAFVNLEESSPIPSLIPF